MAASGTDPAAEVLLLLAEAVEVARRHDRADLVARLTAQLDRLREPRCQVLVIGEFKQGKSSLVNALLNARVCVADADLATAVPTLVRYGPELAATARTGQDDTAPVAVEEIGELVTDDRRRGRARAEVRAVEVAVPRELLRDGLVLVDTPGVGGGLDSAHAAATLRALTAADVVLFVSDAAAEYTAPELDFLRRAAELCPTVVCALTKTDFYPEWRRILAADTAHLHAAALPYEVVPLSAPLRHAGVRTGDRELLVESGYPRLAALLRRSAAATAGTAAGAAATVAAAALAQLAAGLSAELAALRDPAAGARARDRWVTARDQAERLKSGGSRWGQVLSDRTADFASALERDLTARVRAVRRDTAEQVAAGDPDRDWPELERELHRRTNEALLDHARVLKEGADELADAVARQFGSSAWELRVTVDVPGSAATADVELAALATDRSSRVELGLVAARGGSTGVILTHTLGLVLGLALPVTLPATAVLAGVLARRTWRSARSAQLRALRAEAERAVGMYLDEVETAARADSRDAVRAVQRQLREVFTARAAELFTGTVQNLEALSRAVTEDERTRQARAQEVAAEHATVRELAARAGAAADALLPSGPGA